MHSGGSQRIQSLCVVSNLLILSQLINTNITQLTYKTLYSMKGVKCIFGKNYGNGWPHRLYIDLPLLMHGRVMPPT